ncbi:MAG: HNH endonuclease [Flavobacteriaceae bacterium]|nr:HNH endonuclease [Flavobacteriaceae bacterium]
MKIELEHITIRELVEGYQDKKDDGIIGYNGKLDIRPPYQREFVYAPKERDAVIDSVKQGFPLNVMYWSVKKDGTYEILDGQQRTISICQYINKEFSIPWDGYQFNFGNLSDSQQNLILDYKLMVYFCSGTDYEKLNWFRIINIASKPLSSQELRSAVYSGQWTTDAKRYFVKNTFDYFNKYLKGAQNRQDYLETVLKWISGDKIDDFMSRNEHKENAKELWDYFEKIINWVESIFTVYRKEMKGQEWGFLYVENKHRQFCPQETEERIEELMADEDIKAKKGIYKYIFDGKEKHLEIRNFSRSDKRAVYTQQKGICKRCGEKFTIDEMEADHITPWSKGGKTELSNCQILCLECNRRKGPS